MNEVIDLINRSAIPTAEFLKGYFLGLHVRTANDAEKAMEQLKKELRPEVGELLDACYKLEDFTIPRGQPLVPRTTVTLDEEPRT